MILMPQFLEAINGSLLVIFLGLTFFFARYIVLEFRRPDITWRQARTNRSAAIAMVMVFLGESVIRGNVWAWRHLELAPDNPTVGTGVTIGVIICIVGGTCGLRHFAPKEWGRWPWIMVPLIGVVFGVGMTL